MQIKENGVNRDMTPEEMEELERMQAQFPAPAPDPLQTLTGRVDDLEYIITGEVTAHAEP